MAGPPVGQGSKTSSFPRVGGPVGGGTVPSGTIADRTLHQGMPVSPFAAFGEIGKSGSPMPAIPQMDAVWADWGATELDIIKGKAQPAQAWPKMVASVQTKVAG